jgi:hypothetical protein
LAKKKPYFRFVFSYYTPESAPCQIKPEKA